MYRFFPQIPSLYPLRASDALFARLDWSYTHHVHSEDLGDGPCSPGADQYKIKSR